jgi:hypothetical protein
MKKVFPPCLDHRDWKTLYRAAILETNKNVIPQKVSEAELAVLARGRELFYTGGTSEEKESLEDALYALRAFRSALQHTEGEISDTAAEAAAA